MDSSDVINRTSLRAALKYWHQLTELGKCDLVKLEIVCNKITDESDNTPANRGLILRGELLAALTELEQIYKLAVGEENTYYTLLHERYVTYRPVDIVKDSLGIEKTEFFRRQNAAFDAMASILNTRELRYRTELDKLTTSHVTQVDAKPVFQVPRPVSELLVGRSHLLRAIRERLTSGRTTVLQGIPGIGKTSLAIAIAYDKDTLVDYSGGVLWANLGTAPDPLAALRRWGHLLGVRVEVINGASKETLAQSIHDRIGTRSFMIIVDDVWDIELAMLLRVGGQNCHHVFTTRLPQIALSLADASGPLRIEELSLADSITLLSQYVDERTLSAFGISLESLAKASGGLPLTLMLMGCLLLQAMHSGMIQRFRGLLLALQDPAQRMMLSIPIGPNDAGSNAAGHLSVYTQIAGTELVLSDESRRALAALGVLLPKPHSFSSDAALSVGNCTIDAIDELVAYGLLEALPGDRFTFHQSISEHALLRLTDDDAWLRMVRWYTEFAEDNENNYIALDAEWDNMHSA